VIEVLLLIFVGSLFLSFFIRTSQIMLIKKEKIKEVLLLAGQKAEVFIKFGCYGNQEILIKTHSGEEFLCGRGKIEKVK
jgi:hypothetical protein